MGNDTSALSQIMAMQAQGLSNNDIIQNLQRQGFSNSQIFDAMNMADTKAAVENVPKGFMDMPPIDNPMKGKPGTPPSPHPNVGSAPAIPGGDSEITAKTEELIEVIIEEKWAELIKDVNKIIGWKNRAESRLVGMEQKINGLKDNFDNLHRAVIGKVAEYDKHILDVGTEVKAMEKVFSKVLPAFTENVHELSRIVDNAKKN